MIVARRLPAFLAALVAALLVVVSATALERGKDGWFHTGDGVRVKKIAFVSVNVYQVGHDMKELPSAKSKQAVIDADVTKRVVWKMMRDVDPEKIRNALTEGYAMNGFTDSARIGQFLGVLNRELKEGQFVVITYDADKKATTLQVQNGGSVTVPGADFMKATWSLWFGKIDQPSLGDSLISKI